MKTPSQQNTHSDYGDHRSLLLLSFSYEVTIDVLGVALPIFALSLSASPFEIGLLATARAAVYGILTFATGYLSDRTNRRLMLVSSMLLSLLTAALFYVSRNPLELIAFSLFYGLATALFWPTMEALIIKIQDQSVSKSVRNLNLSWGSGAVIGPLIGGAFITVIGLRSPFLLVAAIAVANIVLVAWRIPNKNFAKKTHEESSDQSNSLPVKLISVTVLFGLVISVFFAFFPVFCVEQGFSAFEVGVVLFLFGVTRMFFFYKAQSIRVGPKSMIALASIGLFLIYFGNRATMYIGGVVLAAATGLVYTYTIGHMLNVQENTRGTRAGIFEGSLGVGAILGPFLAGFFAELSMSYTFVFASLMGLIFIIVLGIVEKIKQVPTMSSI